ncbi:MAG TPA: SDR family NAD(P)-dependent oxidoreductase [Kofleriaceae bacterium]|nr:SDR family NAD(P)-dependent oxidoreductase [Kofleriaceae bacterium]
MKPANGNPTIGWMIDKVALVTGGATGIGEAICKVFARAGASVVVNGLAGDPVADVVNEIREAGGTAIAHTGDVGTPEGASGCVAAAVSGFGKLDVLVANAAVFPELKELPEFPLERYAELMHSNVDGVYLVTRAALPELQKTRGSIVTLGSEAGLLGQPQAVSYGATKGWVTAFTRALAAEQAKYGVRANVVAPGPIDTEMTRPSKGNMSVKHALMAVASVPLGRRGTPEEVANVCLFLASDLASFVTGAIYTVDGGATASAGLPGLEAKRDVKRPPEPTVPLEHQHEGRGTLR